MVGIDIVAIARIERILARSGESFLRRFLNKREISLCVGENGNFNAQRIAGFYAAKEAIAKALGCGISKHLAFKDIRLRKNSQGAPKAKLSKRTKKHFGVKKIALSISHDKDKIRAKNTRNLRDFKGDSCAKNAIKSQGFAIAIAIIKRK